MYAWPIHIAGHSEVSRVGGFLAIGGNVVTVIQTGGSIDEVVSIDNDEKKKFWRVAFLSLSLFFLPRTFVFRRRSAKVFTFSQG